MDRLVALLNEFEKERKSWFTWRSIDSYDNCVYGVDCDWETEITMYSDLYSKQFWFIKWLVDNDNIDLDKLKDNITFTTITHSIWIWYDWRTVKEWESIIKAIWTNAIIAYLSIQDNPIEFLISVLR